MEPEKDSPPPVTETKIEPEIKPEPEPDPEPSEHQSSVIMRRQVITTAGIIENEVHSELSNPDEDNKANISTPMEGSPQNNTSIEYEEHQVEQQVGVDILAFASYLYKTCNMEL